MTLLGLPIGGVLTSEVAIAQQRPNLNFRNMQISSAGIQTIGNGSNFSITTISLYIGYNGVNNGILNSRERIAFSEMLLVDSQKKAYLGELVIDLDQPFFYGENRLVKFRVMHPIGTYPKYLQLDSGNPKQPIYISLF
jgi:hypothetical protein